ncbi:MAG TPA: alpha/beta fold hydrolase [Polyangiaceae bacterium]
MTTWLCLHGFTGTPECFRALAAASAPGARFLSPTLTGHGSPPAAWAPSFEAELERLARWLAERQHGPTFLLGYSLGARLALGLLAAAPDRFAGAVLIGANPGLRSDSERRARKHADEQLRKRLLEHGLTAFVDEWERLPLFATQAALEPAVRAEQRRARLTHTAEGLAHALAALGLGEMPDYWPRLAALDLPVALVVGAEDAKFRRLGETMLQLFPRARLELAPRAGHNVVLEQPEWLAQVMQRQSEGAC